MCQLVIFESEKDLQRAFVNNLEKDFYGPLGNRQVGQRVWELADEFVHVGGRGDEFCQEHETVCPLGHKLVYYLDAFGLHKFRFLNL